MGESCKFKVGDKIEVIRGTSMWWNKKDYHLYNKEKPKNIIFENDNIYIIDTTPETIGEKGIIVDAHKTQEIDRYAIKGTSKYAWFTNNEIKKI